MIMHLQISKSITYTEMLIVLSSIAHILKVPNYSYFQFVHGGIN